MLLLPPLGEQKEVIRERLVSTGEEIVSTYAAVQ
jgi:hypothetical protein